MKPLELLEQGRFLGEEFLLWLWMRGTTEGGTSGEEGDSSGLFVDDAILMACERGECKQIALSKGNPSECREAFEAICRGMRPAKLKLRILSGDLEWVGTLTAATLRLSALKLPPSTGKAPHERLHDRIFLLEEGHGHLERRFNRFLQERLENPEGLQETLKAWALAGASGEAVPMGEAPWEAPTGLMSEVKALSPTAQEALQSPKFRRAVSKFMSAATRDGTICTISMPGMDPVTITPESAARASKALRGGP